MAHGVMEGSAFVLGKNPSVAIHLFRSGRGISAAIIFEVKQRTRIHVYHQNSFDLIPTFLEAFGEWLVLMWSF